MKAGGVGPGEAAAVSRFSEDAIKPWQTRSWLFVGDPDFRVKAHRVLDLYARRFEDQRLRH